MGRPRRMLADDEEVVVDVRPHWWFLAGPVAALVLVVAGSVAAALAGAAGWEAWSTVAALALSLLWMLARYVRWATTRLVVTSSRIIERRGVIARRGREIPLGSLTDIGYRQSLFERIIGAGDVVLESAGRDGQELFADLPHPALIHNEIYRQMEARRSVPPAPAAAAPPPGRPSLSAQIEELDQLRRRGLITDAEFEAKKTQLLDRL